MSEKPAPVSADVRGAPRRSCTAPGRLPCAARRSGSCASQLTEAQNGACLDPSAPPWVGVTFLRLFILTRSALAWGFLGGAPVE